MNKKIKNKALIFLSLILIFQAFIPVIFAMDSEDNQHIEGFNYIFDEEPIDYDIGYVADIMEYLEEQLEYDINIPEETEISEDITITQSVYDINVQYDSKYDSTVTNDVYNTDNVDNLGHLIDLPEIRALSWKDLKVNYLMASVYGKVLLDRPIDYSINKYEFEIYKRFLWLLENKNLTYEQKNAVYTGIYYIISSEYKIVKAAMNDARNLVEFDAAKKSETLLRQAENHWEAVIDQLKKGNTLPAMISLQHANFKAHEVLQIYGYEYTMENLKVDSDGDGLIDLAENMYNTDPNNADTDGDHLNDLFEIETTQTNPTTEDTDENGITDDMEDFDNDGLTNIEEFNHGTDPYSEDTDQDRLSDYAEVHIHKTIPTIYDTDGDTVGDGREIELGLNPLVMDTDGDGIIDDMERFSQNITIDEEDQTHFEEIGVIPQVTIHGPALEPHNVYIRDAHTLWKRLENNVGLIGHAVDIETGYNFDKATITFQYTEEALNGAKPENLRVLWYDEQNDKYVLMPNTYLDLESKTVSVETTHFSIYMLADKEKLVQAFSKPYDAGRPTNIRGEIQDVIIATAFNDQYQGYLDYGLASMADLANVKNSGTIINQLVNPQQFQTVSKSMTLEEAVNKLSTVDSNKWKALIYPVDNQTALNSINKEDIIRKAVENNIKIFPVNTDGTKTLLIDIANGTFAEGFNIKFQTETDAIKVLRSIYDKIKMEEDKDSDGIPDQVEQAGMRIETGEFIITRTDKKDTDGDGLSDGFEMGYTDEEGNPFKEVSMDTINLNDQLTLNTSVNKTSKSVRISAIPYEFGSYNKTESDPRKKDTDGDSHDDSPDIEKKIPYVTPVFLLHGYTSHNGNVYGAYNRIAEKNVDPLNDYWDHGDDPFWEGYSQYDEQKIISYQTDANGLARKIISLEKYEEEDVFLFNYAARGDYYKSAATFSNYLNNLTTGEKPIIKSPTKDGKIKIDMVVHSMGGLVARSYIELSKDPNARLFKKSEYRPTVEVRKLITLATPHWGGVAFGKSIEFLSEKSSDPSAMLNPNHCIFRGCDLDDNNKYIEDYHHNVSFKENYNRNGNTRYYFIIGDPIEELYKLEYEGSQGITTYYRQSEFMLNDTYSPPYKRNYDAQVNEFFKRKSKELYGDEKVALIGNGYELGTIDSVQAKLAGHDDFVTVNSGLGYKEKKNEGSYIIEADKKRIFIGPSETIKRAKIIQNRVYLEASCCENNDIVKDWSYPTQKDGSEIEYNGVNHSAIHHNQIVMGKVVEWLQE